VGAEFGGGGTGAGAFCAGVTGARSAIAIVVRRKMRRRWLIDGCLGRKHETLKSLGRMSAQVKRPDANLPGIYRAHRTRAGASNYEESVNEHVQRHTELRRSQRK
jgi:hypothetical protein